MSTSALNDDVFSALLALDAYNRGYNQGIELDAAATGLGYASFFFDEVGDDAKAASFYARAYSYNGEIVIAYRGTDQMGWDDQSWGDVVNGWGLGGGILAVPQVALALDFYHHLVIDDAQGSSVRLTGHSLGGGLAGFVGALYGNEATIFDSMPYIGAAEGLYAILTSTDPLEPSEQALNDQWRQLVYGGAAPWAPSFTQVEGYFVEGEVLQGLRWALETNAGLHRIDAAANLGWIDLHSQSLLTLLLYGEKQVSPQREDWVAAKEYLVTALFDHGVGHAAGAAQIDGTSKRDGDFANILRTTLAYSMIDGGTHHFGDSGIHALFDDANDLGRALSLPNATRNLQLSAQALAQSFTQYAGQLAIGKVEAAQGSEERAGVLTLSADETVLSVDFGQERWRAGMKDGADPDLIVGREALVANDNLGDTLRMAA